MRLFQCDASVVPCPSQMVTTLLSWVNLVTPVPQALAESGTTSHWPDSLTAKVCACCPLPGHAACAQPLTGRAPSSTSLPAPGRLCWSCPHPPYRAVKRRGVHLLEGAFQSLSQLLTHMFVHLAEGLVVEWLERKQALSNQFNKYCSKIYAWDVFLSVTRKANWYSEKSPEKANLTWWEGRRPHQALTRNTRQCFSTLHCTSFKEEGWDSEERKLQIQASLPHQGCNG